MGERAVAKASSLLGRLMLLVAHVVRGRSIGILVEGIAGGVAGDLILLVVLVVLLGGGHLRHDGDIGKCLSLEAVLLIIPKG